jgi:hypothetical protein
LFNEGVVKFNPVNRRVPLIASYQLTTEEEVADKFTLPPPHLATSAATGSGVTVLIVAVTGILLLIQFVPAST